MKELYMRLKMAFKIARKRELIVYVCEPHRCLPDGTIESESELFISDDIHPTFIEFAYDDCLNQFDYALNVVVEETEMEFLVQEAQLMLNK